MEPGARKAFDRVVVSQIEHSSFDLGRLHFLSSHFGWLEMSSTHPRWKMLLRQSSAIHEEVWTKVQCSELGNPDVHGNVGIARIGQCDSSIVLQGS